MAVDPDKVRAILEAPAPINANGLSRFLGKIRWYSRMIRYLADVAIPLYTTLHKTPFQWTTIEQNAYDCLKRMLTKVPMVLGQALPHVCRYIGHSNREFVNGVVGAQLL